MQSNFDLCIGEKTLLFLETSPKAGIRIVGEGRSGWGTIVTIESAETDVLGELSWALQEKLTFNSAGEINVGSAYERDHNTAIAEALMLVLTKLRDTERKLERSETETEATSEWHKNNPESMGR